MKILALVFLSTLFLCGCKSASKNTVTAIPITEHATLFTWGGGVK